MSKIRLTHTSLESYLRSLQISHISIFVFVEGLEDRSFYDKLCGIVCRPSGVSFAVRLANEVPTCCGGKEGLMTLFEYLQANNELVTEFHGKRTVTAFCLDKDIDDRIGKPRESDHLIYTEYYSLENYYFLHGNLIEAISVTSCLPRSDVEAVVGDCPAEWCRRASENWKMWCLLCLLAVKLGVRCECTFRLTSKVHTQAYGRCDDAKVSDLCSTIRGQTRLDEHEFDAYFDQVRDEIEMVYSKGEQDSVFPGSWYMRFVIEDTERIANSRSYDKNSVGKDIMKCLATTLDYTACWAERYRLFFNAQIAEAGL